MAKAKKTWDKRKIKRTRSFIPGYVASSLWQLLCDLYARVFACLNGNWEAWRHQHRQQQMAKLRQKRWWCLRDLKERNWNRKGEWWGGPRPLLGSISAREFYSLLLEARRQDQTWVRRRRHGRCGSGCLRGRGRERERAPGAKLGGGQGVDGGFEGEEVESIKIEYYIYGFASHESRPFGFPWFWNKILLFIFKNFICIKIGSQIQECM